MLTVLILSAVVAGGAFAQGQWYNSYAPGIAGSKLLVNAGIGFGLLPYAVKIPALSASVEYALPKIPLSIGGYAGFTTYGEGWYSGSMTGIGAKASWHFNFVKNIDPYVSLTLGYLIWNETWDPPGYKVKTDYSTFLYGVNIGGRYFFTKNIGIYAELGYSAVSLASLGLALKF
jgi:hypothetical protein